MYKHILIVCLLSLGIATGGAMAKNAHDFDFTSIDGAPLALSEYEGKAVLMVNTASFCGFTKQYTNLQSLWESYRDKGLVVLGVPSNDFGNQEPNAEAEIKEFCEVNFDVDFPMTSKNVVKGDEAHPFYLWAAEELGAENAPKWNFHKYLIAPDGQLLQAFSSKVEPDGEEITSAIETILPN